MFYGNSSYTILSAHSQSKVLICIFHLLILQCLQKGEIAYEVKLEAKMWKTKFETRVIKRNGGTTIAVVNLIVVIVKSIS